DDHFLFTDEIVDQQTEWTPIALSNNQECLTGIFGSGSNAKPLVQPQHRQQPFTHHYHFLTVLHTEHGAGSRAKNLGYRIERHNIPLAANRHHKAIDYG